jgi:5-methylcytosine-specific restriction endonuclease McrA
MVTAMRKHPTIAPDSSWQEPASTWRGAIERYATFAQVPKWRASVRRDGSEHTACLSSAQAESLQSRMLSILARLGGTDRLRRKPDARDLETLWLRCGREIPRSERCPAKLHVHLQRAFLLNKGSYTCFYCRRTDWGVYGEESGEATPRTLRFEVEHRRTRRRLPDPSRFNVENLVAACRSCNAIKGEMLVERFWCELESLSRAVIEVRSLTESQERRHSQHSD